MRALHSRTFIVAMGGCIACGNALAQFAATGGPSAQEEFLFLVLPWIVVAAVLMLGWFGPQRLRPMLRRASKRALVAYLGIASTLFVSMLVLSAIYGPNTEPLMTVGVFFLMSVFLSGLLISALMAVALIFFGARFVLKRCRARAAIRE